mmetsp:Transcript_85977/g.216411  ORF Transcript_85977/g.216411 Transcript_85977/m.216411 type:complete len:83 (-) Transcript_85977:1076-1324(-)
MAWYAFVTQVSGTGTPGEPTATSSLTQSEPGGAKRQWLFVHLYGEKSNCISIQRHGVGCGRSASATTAVASRPLWSLDLCAS